MTERSALTERDEDHQTQGKPQSAKPDQAGQLKSGRDQSGDQSEKQSKSAAEWITFAISLGIVLLLAGSIIFLSLSNSGAPAAIEVKLLREKTYRAGETYYLPLEITNRGDRTAEDVMIMVKLSGGEGGQAGQGQAEPEEKEVSIGLLAGGSTADAVLAFRTDPAKGQLEAEVVSYVKP